jgi:hypothetical protein
LTLKGVDGLHVNPEEEFNKGNSHIRGERQREKVILMRCWHEIFLSAVLIRELDCGISGRSIFELHDTINIMFVVCALCHRFLVIIGIR